MIKAKIFWEWDNEQGLIYNYEEFINCKNIGILDTKFTMCTNDIYQQGFGILVTYRESSE